MAMIMRRTTWPNTAGHSSQARSHSRPAHGGRSARSPAFGATAATLILAGLGLLLASCSSPTHPDGPRGKVALRYVGSSTIAHFIRAADLRYGPASFSLDTAPESSGGEAALLAGEADIAGVARPPTASILRAGVAAVEIGRDAIAIIVHPSNPLDDLSRQQLRGIFSGQLRNWSQLGGSDLPIVPFVVGPESATRNVFRAAVLCENDYDGCQVVRPDREILTRVAGEPGAIGQLSFSFLSDAAGVKPLAVDGQQPAVTNFDYPITRPLYLLWRKGRAPLDEFVSWVLSEAGQRVVMGQFVGNSVIASVQSGAGSATANSGRGLGHLIVYTDTDTIYDGGIYYYPHLSYEVLSRSGELIQRVRNHRGDNDETPTRVSLPPGTYWIRARTAGAETAEFFVTIVADETTSVSVAELQTQRQS